MNRNREKVNTSLIFIKINFVIVPCQIYYHSLRQPIEFGLMFSAHCLDAISIFNFDKILILYLIRYGYRWKDG